MQVELKRAIGSDWGHAADQLEARLTSLDNACGRLLIILDELPILISRMLRDERKRDAELLLSRLRRWRQAPALRGKVCTLIGGSIGLEGIVRRAGLSGSINDLVPFPLNSWDRIHRWRIPEGAGQRVAASLLMTNRSPGFWIC